MSVNSLRVILEELPHMRPWMMRSGCRCSADFDNASVFVIKGFPGMWTHQDVLDYFTDGGISGCVVDFGLQFHNQRQKRKPWDLLFVVII